MADSSKRVDSQNSFLSFDKDFDSPTHGEFLGIEIRIKSIGSRRIDFGPIQNPYEDDQAAQMK